MGELPKHKNTTDVTGVQSTKQTSNATLLLLTTALDTTWRTLVPGIAGTIVGIILDHVWHSIPVMTIIGLVLGIGLSILLIYRQFRAVKS